jgi:hypothetical protein
MTALEILKIIVAIATILTGAVSLFWPLRVKGFTGLEVSSGRGITEIRAVLGGVFIGLGAAVIYLRDPAAYMTLGITYLCHQRDHRSDFRCDSGALRPITSTKV